MITYLIIGTTTIVSFICFRRRDLLNKLSFNPILSGTRGCLAEMLLPRFYESAYSVQPATYRR